MALKFQINSNTAESDKVDNRISQFFLPSIRYNSPTLILPTDPNNTGTLTATITYGDLIGSDNIFISSNGNYNPVILTLPPKEDIFALFSYPVEGSTRTWNIGYDCNSSYNIVSPDVVDPETLCPIQLFQNPQSVSVICMTISIYPYGVSYGQDYGMFVTSSSNIGNMTVDYSSNVIVGYNYPDRKDFTGNNNTIIGRQCGSKLTTGYDNTIVGYNAGYNLSTGIQNSIFGLEAGRNLTSGQCNTVVGQWAGFNLTTGSNNTLIGYSAGNNVSTASANTMVGFYAGLFTTGSSNTIIGDYAGYGLTSGQNNVFVGASSCDSATTGSGNVSIGNNTLENLIVGSNNTAIGNGAGDAFVGDSNGCIAIGSVSGGGAGVTAVNSTYIGVGAMPSGNVTNEVVLGSEIQGKGSNTTVIGGISGCYFYSPCIGAFQSNTIDPVSSTIFWNGIIVNGMDPSTNYQYLNFRITGTYEIILSGTLYTATAGTAVVTFYKNGALLAITPLTIQTSGGCFTVCISSMINIDSGDSFYLQVSNNVVSNPAMSCYFNIKYVSL